jgi:hypothetical protein
MSDLDIFEIFDDIGDILSMFILVTFFLALVTLVVHFYRKCNFDHAAMLVIFLQLIAFIAIFIRASITYVNHEPLYTAGIILQLIASGIRDCA